MTRSTLIVITAALLLGGTSLASAKNRAGAHSKPLRQIPNEITPQIPNETTPRATVADPFYRLSDAYYGDYDPYRGLFNFYALPPYSPGSAYGHVRPIGGQ
jgi:hypothetical protein